MQTKRRRMYIRETPRCVHAIKKTNRVVEKKKKKPIHFTVDLLHTNKGDGEPVSTHSSGGLSQDGIYRHILGSLSLYIYIYTCTVYIYLYCCRLGRTLKRGERFRVDRPVSLDRKRKDGHWERLVDKRDDGFHFVYFFLSFSPNSPWILSSLKAIH